MIPLWENGKFCVSEPDAHPNWVGSFGSARYTWRYVTTLQFSLVLAWKMDWVLAWDYLHTLSKTSKMSSLDFKLIKMAKSYNCSIELLPSSRTRAPSSSPRSSPATSPTRRGSLSWDGFISRVCLIWIWAGFHQIWLDLQPNYWVANNSWPGRLIGSEIIINFKILVSV